jgi:hypothetical protein
MKKDEWEIKYHYRKSEHNCSWCKHCEGQEVELGIFRFSCLKKREAGAGETVKPS